MAMTPGHWYSRRDHLSASRAKNGSRMARPSDQASVPFFVSVNRAQKEPIRLQIAMIRSGNKMFDTAVAGCNTIHDETVMSFLKTVLGL